MRAPCAGQVRNSPAWADLPSRSQQLFETRFDATTTGGAAEPDETALLCSAVWLLEAKYMPT